MTDENDCSDDGRPAFLFRAGEFAAVTLDSHGKNLPAPEDATQWGFVRTFTLGVRHAALSEINPEPVIRGIRARGYYVWRVSRGGEGQSQ